MKNFKLIAIRPLEDCAIRFTKVLFPGIIYPFYQGYKFYNAHRTQANAKDEIRAFSSSKSSLSGFHSIITADGYPIDINISAVVGKNGSGKSSLTDLFFAALYMFSLSEGILPDTPKTLRKVIQDGPENIAVLENDLNHRKKKREEIIKKFNKSVLEKKNIPSYEQLIGEVMLNEQMIDLTSERHELAVKNLTNAKTTLKEQLEMVKGLKVEFYYEVGKTLFCLRIYPEKDEPASSLLIVPEINHEELSKETHLPTLKSIPASSAVTGKYFFYSIAINYSHYALNATHVGNWVNSLFHKNDGYTTPLVLNPMRNDGNFIINDELARGKYRLLSNLLTQQKLLKDKKLPISLTEHLMVNKVWLTLNVAKVEEQRIYIVNAGLAGQKADKLLIKDFFKVFFENEDFEKNLPEGNQLVDLALNYILGKIQSMQKYSGLNTYKVGGNVDSFDNLSYFNKLKEEPSHITFKLNQAVHFLRRAADRNWPNIFALPTLEYQDGRPLIFTPTLSELLDWTGDPLGHELINFLPPSIFIIDFELSGKNQESSFFNQLSSGEQQMIHTIQTVLYHLNNLQSVHYSKLHRFPYRAVNIIFDEIELYFHPAYQRAFIQNLRKAIGFLYLGGKGIESINIIFLTHSPFFLSDIPSEHIMLLSIDKLSGKAMPSIPEKQTFAANLNEVLADSFFLDGTLIGEFAEDVVNLLIKAIRNGDDLSQKQRKLINLIGDSYLRNSLKYFITRSND